MNFVKCGDKGRHLDIMDGYRLMNKDEIVNTFNFEFCRVANIYKLHWDKLDKDDIDLNVGMIGDHVIIDEKYIPIEQEFVNIKRRI